MIHCYFEFVALQNERNRAVLNFARFVSLICIVARSREKSRSLSLVPFLARCRSLSLPGLATRGEHILDIVLSSDPFFGVRLLD